MSISYYLALTAALVLGTNVVTWWLARRFGIIEGFTNHSTDPTVRAILKGADIDVEGELDRLVDRRQRNAQKVRGIGNPRSRR